MSLTAWFGAMGVRPVNNIFRVKLRYPHTGLPVEEADYSKEIRPYLLCLYVHGENGTRTKGSVWEGVDPDLDVIYLDLNYLNPFDK